MHRFMLTSRSARQWVLLGAVPLLALTILSSLVGCGGASATAQEATPPGKAYQNPSVHVEAMIPEGWHASRRPLTNVVDPQQVLAAASYSLPAGKTPEDCWPSRALAARPDSGVLLEVVEYVSKGSGKGSVGHFQPRPSHFRYSDAEFSNFECAGPSYKFDFVERGRDFQAQVWLNRKAVDPETRKQALEILDSFHPTA